MKAFSTCFFTLFLLITSFSAISQTPEELFFLGLNNEELLAAQYLKNGEYEKAAVLYEKLFDAKPGPFYYGYLLDCYIAMEDYPKAEKFLKKQLRQKPGKPRYLVDIGYIYQLENEHRKARKQFEGAIRGIISEPAKTTDLANAFLLRGLDDYAIQTYHETRKTIKTPYAFCYELAAIYEDNNNIAAMTEEYLRLIEADPITISEVQSKLQAALSVDPEGKKNEAFKEVVLKNVQKNPEKIYLSELLFWHSIQQKDFEMAFIQAKALDRRLNGQGERVFYLAQLCTSNSYYDIAIQCYEYILKKGKFNVFYTDSKIQHLNVKFLKLTSQYIVDQKELLLLETEYMQTINDLGESAFTIPLMKNLANLQAFYLDKTPQAIELLNKAINMPGANRLIQAECKTALADILLMNGDVWEATLLYSQVEKAFKNDPVGHAAKFKNARLSYFIAEYDWAKAQLDVLKAATSKLIANDAMDLSLLISDNIDPDSTYEALRFYSRAEMFDFQKKPGIAIHTLDSLISLFPHHPILDEAFYKKGLLLLSLGKFTEADSIFQIIYTTYAYDILADDALFKSAKLNQERFKSKNKAMDLYQKLLIQHPGSLYTVEARKRYRELRGDQPD